MSCMENCKEKFLDGIIEAFVYTSDNTSFPKPFSVPQITGMTACSLKNPALRIAMTDTADAEADSISAKVTPELSGNGTVFTHEITISVTQGIENVRQAHKNIAGKDCYVVFTTSGGETYLSYTCPGSFVFKPTAISTSTDPSLSLTITLKSMSDFILITTTT
jgi:hypothetical protein